ncbi:dihydrolipoamide acetyltransferase family protein [Rhodococcus koreensis]
MNIRQFQLPDVGEGLEEAELVTWRIAVGDEVTQNQIIVEIETAKSLVELPSPFAGTVLELLVEEGQTVPVGTPIIAIENREAEDSPAATPDPSNENSTIAATTTPNILDTSEGPVPPVLVGYGPAGNNSRPRRRRRAAETKEKGAPTRSGPRAAPLVRRLAEEKGIHLEKVLGTGPKGRIVKSDVLGAVQTLATAAAASNPTLIPLRESDGDGGVGQTRIPIRGVRKATAAAMSTSAFTAPHVTEFLTVDVTRSVKMVERLKSDPRFTGTRVTMLLLVARALLAAIREFPDINSSWDEQAAEIVLHHHVNLGIAAATPRGLMVPNVKRADELSLLELADALTSLVTTAKEGRSAPKDLSHGTITITNIGVFGVDAGTPILNPGEAAILCLGAVRRTPWEHRGKLALRWTTQLALSFDHRLVDGELGSKFLAALGRILENPRWELLLT